MAWDTEETRRLLLDAGARQFARHGLAGARMDVIGRDAGVNKERVYRYFGDKDGFFDAVLARELATMMDGLTVNGTGSAAVGDFAFQLATHWGEHETLPRLLAWEGLERDAVAAEQRRHAMCASIENKIRAALPGLDHDTAAHLLLSIISLVAGAPVFHHVAMSIDPAIADDQSRRRAIAAQITLLAEGLFRGAQDPEETHGRSRQGAAGSDAPPHHSSV